MLILKPDDIPSSEITSEHLYLNRRRFLRAGGALAGASLLTACRADATQGAPAQDATGKRVGLQPDDDPTPYKDITTYNNFYEFGTGKGDPSQNAKDFHTEGWKVKISGAVKHPATYHLEDLLKPVTQEDRVYRMRCVEAWSMVIPWRGFMLRDLIKRVEPTSKARYVAFTTLYDPDRMPGQKRDVLPWPYVEGLRMDEAMHPLTLLATGLYGKSLPPQDGAPIRLVVPWKYGFKGIKSIVEIRFVEKQPPNTWNIVAPNEYGFYANVNPEVDHPRWSQARERRIGEWRKRPTLMFNGYADQVASLYKGMDLRKNF